MTVDALLEEWDLSYAAFASCLELLLSLIHIWWTA